MKIYFIRHAEGYHNLSNEGWKIFYPDLTNLGIEQSKNLGNELKSINFDQIIVSPLKRTLKTAELVFGKKQFIIDENIREYVGNNCDFRESNDELKNLFPYLNFDNLKVIDYNSYENDEIVDNRIKQFFEWLSNNNYQTIAVVSHGGFLNRFFKKYHQELKIENTDFLNNCGYQIGYL